MQVLEHIFDGQFGLTTILTMLDDDDNCLKWFGTSPGAHATEMGGDYWLTGTVRKHGEYKGVKETLLTRCSLSV